MGARVISQAEREATRARMKAWWADPANKAKVAERQRERMRNDPEYRAATFGAMTSDEARERAKIALRAALADPNNRKRLSRERAQLTRESWANPEHRERRMAGMAEANARPETTERRSEGGRRGAEKRWRISGGPVRIRVESGAAALAAIPVDPFAALLFGGAR